MAMTANVRAALVLVARGEAPLGIVYATDAKVEPGVKIVGVFPDDSHEPIIYPVAATADAKPEVTPYLAFLRSQAATDDIRGLRIYGSGKADIVTFISSAEST